MAATNGFTDGVALGGTSIVVRPLGIGTNRWSSGAAARPELVEVFRAALDAGVTLFDSAEVYGMGGSERALGFCLASLHADGSDAEKGRQKPVIVSKFFPLPWRLSRKAMDRALRGSLGRLGLPSIDLYLVHFPFPPVSVESWSEALADVCEAGYARAVGVSNFNVAQMRSAHEVLAKRGVPLACNEVEFSLLSRNAEKSGLLAACRDLNVTLVAYRPLALGLLPGKHSRRNPPAGWRGLAFRSLYPPQVTALSELLAKTGEAHGGKTVAQVALNWVLCKGALPIPGATRAEHIEENAGALGWQLSSDEVAELDDAAERARVG